MAEIALRAVLTALFFVLAWFVSPWWFIGVFAALICGPLVGYMIGAVLAAVLYPGWGLLAFIPLLLFFLSEEGRNY